MIGLFQRVRLGKRQVNEKIRAVARFADSLDRAAVGFDDAFGDGQSETSAALVASRIDLIKPVENFGEMFDGNSRAGVGHRDVEVSVEFLQQDLDCPAGGSVA